MPPSGAETKFEYHCYGLAPGTISHTYEYCLQGVYC